MSTLSTEVWTRLAAGRPHGEMLWARRAAPDTTTRLLAALDADGRRHYLIRLEPGEVELHDERSRGLGVMTRDLAIPGHEAGSYVDITCHDVSGHAAFHLIGGDLAERLRKDTETPAASVAHVLAKWRRFWSELPRPILARQEQIGLFAEIWFLYFWLVPRIGPPAIVRWRGPLGSRHDFEWPGRSIEIKGTTSSRGTVHRINGIEQLAPPDRGDLFFFSLHLREEGGASNSLPKIVNACREGLSSDDEASAMFESHLARLGYQPAHEPEYESLRLRVVAEELFAVRDDFPRLVPESLPSGCPQGVVHVDYEISLDGFERLRVACKPDDPVLDLLLSVSDSSSHG